MPGSGRPWNGRISGLTPVYEAVCRVVEDLRYDPKPELEQDLKALTETCEQLFD